MAIKRTFPRARVKQIIKKKHKSTFVQRKVDMLEKLYFMKNCWDKRKWTRACIQRMEKLFLDYMMFLKRLAQKAEQNAEENRQKIVTSDHIRAVSKKVLKSVRG